MEGILIIIFVVYVISSLSTIKHQNKLIMNHLNINDEPPPAPIEEIEKDLESKE